MSADFRHPKRRAAADLEALAAALPAYEIGAELGRGASGLVVAARHRQLGRDVAVKLLWSRFADDADIGARFVAEARVLATLDHPHVVLVYDYVQRDELCLLVMERLTGGTVKALLADGRSDPRAACAVVVATCAGLHHAHGKGVLHRDIKPQNLLLSADGVVKVADFGVAKVMAGSAGVSTRAGLMVGTPTHMAPEQVTGEPLSPATDVYAAGTVLYELLCGKLPFPVAGDPLALLYRRVHDDPVALHELAPEVPRSLAAITERALQRAPSDRYATAAALAAAVHQAASEEWGPEWLAETNLLRVGEPPAGDEPETLLEAPARPVAPARRGPLERDRELRSITEALQSAAGGSGRLLVVEGPPGIGKSRLLEEARAMATSRGFGCAAATGYETERPLAWGIVRQLVERNLLRFAPQAREELLEGPAGRVLAALHRAPSDPAADEVALAPTLHALWWAAADLSAVQPLLLTVDDVQWADRSSLRFLAYLARRVGDLSIVVLVASRAPDPDDDALRELLAVQDGEHIAPRPLSEEAVGALARARGALPGRAVVRALHRSSGGNPFFVGQLLAELQRRECALDDPQTVDVLQRLGPETIARTLLGRLGPDARNVAGVLAVVGEREGRELAIRLSGLDTAAWARAIDELVAADVLADGDEPVFSHPVVREAALTSMTRGRRAALHGEVAAHLARQSAPADRVAAHLALAPPGALPEAATWLRTAAQALSAAGDAASAAGHLRRAVAEDPADPGLVAELGEALLRSGQPAEARERLRAAAGRTAAPLERARWLSAAASATLALEGPAAAAAELRAVIDEGIAGNDPDARILLEAHLAGVCSFEPDEFRRCGERLSRYADLPGTTIEQRALLSVIARRWLAEVRPASEVAALARRALGDDSWPTAGAADYASLAGAVHALVMADDVATVRRNLDRVQHTLRDGSPWDFILITGVRMLVTWREGDVDATAAHAAAALDALALADRDPAMAALHAVATRQQVLALVEMDDLTGAQASLESYEAAAAGDAVTIPGQRVRHAAAVLALAAGDPGRARFEAEALAAAERAAGADNPAIPWRLVLARAAARLGDARTARTVADEQLRLARAWGAPTDLGAALRLVAQLDPERRLLRLTEAVETLERSPCRLELAYALCDLADAWQRELPGADAREPLRRASELARECGARRLRRRAEATLSALGERTEREGPATALTPSERRVAELAVSGRSPRDIAQQLFVTPKAVENQLGRVCAKLGIDSTSQLSLVLVAS